MTASDKTKDGGSSADADTHRATVTPVVSGPSAATIALAEYLTGPCVAAHSIGLSLSGMSKVTAERYFALRAIFGVSGYASKDEAIAAIAKATTAAETVSVGIANGDETKALPTGDA